MPSAQLPPQLLILAGETIVPLASEVRVRVRFDSTTEPCILIETKDSIPAMFARVKAPMPPQENVSSSGIKTVGLDIAKLLERVKQLDKKEPIGVTVDGKTIFLVQGRFSRQIPTFDPDTLPIHHEPESKGEVSSFNISLKDLARFLKMAKLTSDYVEFLTTDRGFRIRAENGTDSDVYTVDDVGPGIGGPGLSSLYSIDLLTQLTKAGLNASDEAIIAFGQNTPLKIDIMDEETFFSVLYVLASRNKTTEK